MAEEKKVKSIKPTTLKLRMLAKDGKWKTKDVETIAQTKAVSTFGIAPLLMFWSLLTIFIVLLSHTFKAE